MFHAFSDTNSVALTNGKCQAIRRSSFAAGVAGAQEGRYSPFEQITNDHGAVGATGNMEKANGLRAINSTSTGGTRDHVGRKTQT